MVNRLKPVLYLIGLIWAVEAVNLVLDHSLNRALGLYPRSWEGLLGVVTMPLLHGSVGHAMSNTVPLAILGTTAVLVAPARFSAATIAIVIVSGLAVWLLARPGTIHVGASGLIFGWFGYVVALGVIERSLRALAGAVLVVVVYGGMIWGVVPTGAGQISWEAHLFGALAGGIIAWAMRTPRSAARA